MTASTGIVRVWFLTLRFAVVVHSDNVIRHEMFPRSPLYSWEMAWIRSIFSRFVSFCVVTAPGLDINMEYELGNCLICPPALCRRVTQSCAAPHPSPRPALRRQYSVVLTYCSWYLLKNIKIFIYFLALKYFNVHHGGWQGCIVDI